jgi:hypothetical protein
MLEGCLLSRLLVWTWCCETKRIIAPRYYQYNYYLAVKMDFLLKACYDLMRILFLVLEGPLSRRKLRKDIAPCLELIMRCTIKKNPLARVRINMDEVKG